MRRYPTSELQRLFSVATLLSLLSCALFSYVAAKLQYFDNQFGPLGISNIPSVPGFYQLDVMWYPAMALAVLPVIWLAVHVLSWLRSRWHARPGFCARCGYNLTGNVSGICSECGTPVPAKSEAAA